MFMITKLSILCIIISSITNREIAGIILIVGFIVFVLILSKGKDNSLKTSLIDIIKSAKKVANVFTVYLIYVSLLLFLTKIIGLWQIDYIKDIIIIVFGSLIYLVTKTGTTKSGIDFWRDVIISAIGAMAFFQFYINTVSFSIPGEMLMQFILFVCIIVNAFSKGKKETKSVFILSNVVLMIIVVIVIIHTTKTIFNDFEILVGSIPTLIISIWLPLAIAPFTYIFLLVCAYEQIFIRDKYVYNKPLAIRAKVVMILMFGMNLFYISNFSGKYQRDIQGKEKLKEIIGYLSYYKSELNMIRLAENTRIKNLKKYAGNTGIDIQGCRLDRREFFETKKLMDDIYFTERGLSRNANNHYNEDVLKMIIYPITIENENDNCGVQFVISSDKKKYCAWRKTIGGWYFGVGGTERWEEKWLFSGDTNPTSFPGDEDTRWTEVELNNNDMPVDWSFDDSPKI